MQREQSEALKAKARPLEGIKVVECGVWHAGPGASAILGDLGAEVIKVETLGGDPERFFGAFGPMDSGRKDMPNWTLLFEFSNRNKRGICLDIAQPEGRAILHQLVAQADVFVTNLRQGTKPKLGIDYESLRKINPQLIHANVSGFGPKGAMSDVGGFDPMGQAISGMMYMTGEDEPLLLQTIVLDQMTAITTSHAILTALLVRERRGIGQEVHVSLYGTATWLLHANLLTTSVLKQNIQVKWDRRKNPPLRNSFKCSDGKWIMGTNHPEHKYWPAFCAAVGQPQLEQDLRFATSELRATNMGELTAILDEVFRTKPQREWLQILFKGGLLYAPIQALDEVLQDSQALDNGYVMDYEHPALGKLRVPGYPVQFSEHTAGPHMPAPMLGEHTDAVLGAFGYSAADIERLRSSHVIL